MEEYTGEQHLTHKVFKTWPQSGYVQNGIMVNTVQTLPTNFVIECETEHIHMPL